MPKTFIPPFDDGVVRMRMLTADDLPLTRAWRNQPDIRRWFVHSAVISDEQHRKWFADYENKADDLTFVIEELSSRRGSSGQPVGQAALYRIDAAKRTCEFGRLMIGEPAARGRGLAKRAVQLLAALAFHSLKLDRVDLEVVTNNVRARGLYEQLGFTIQGGNAAMTFMSLDRKSIAKSKLPPVRLLRAS